VNEPSPAAAALLAETEANILLHTAAGERGQKVSQTLQLTGVCKLGDSESTLFSQPPLAGRDNRDTIS